MTQTILEHYPTPTEARARCLKLRVQGIHAWMYHDLPDVQSGAELLERMRQTTTVAWTWVFDCPYDDPE